MNSLNLYRQEDDNFVFIDTRNRFVQHGAGWEELYVSIKYLDGPTEPKYGMWTRDISFLLPAEFFDQETPERYIRNE